MAISIKDKREFFKFLLDNYAIKQREAVWIINYLASDSKLMERVHFVDEVKHTNVGIMISTNCVKEPPFAFFRNANSRHGTVTTDAENAFHQIRKLRSETDEQFYLQINFKNKLQSYELSKVLEENPYASKEVDSSITKVANRVIKEMEKRNVKHLIDLALDAKDQERFNYLVGGLNK